MVFVFSNCSSVERVMSAFSTRSIKRQHLLIALRLFRSHTVERDDNAAVAHIGVVGTEEHTDVARHAGQN